MRSGHRSPTHPSRRHSTGRTLTLALVAAGTCACTTLWGRDYQITRFRRKVVVTNPTDRARPNAVVVLPCTSLAKILPRWEGVEVTEGAVVLPSQLDDLDQDHVPDEVVFIVDLGPRETKTLSLTSLTPNERGLVLPRRVQARPGIQRVGYPAIESELAGYRLRCTYPKDEPRGALQLDVCLKAARALETADSAGTGEGPDNKGGRAKVWMAGDSFGLAGPTIGQTRPRDGETAIVFHRILCDGPLRAGIQVDVMHWRTPAGGIYRARLQYFTYAWHEFVELRATVKPQTPAGEFFGLGLATSATPHPVCQDWRKGCLGNWLQATSAPAGLGIGLAYRPQAAASVVGTPGAASWLAGNQVVYLKPKLDTEEAAHWRLLLAANSPAAGVANAQDFGLRLARLAADLREPILVDGQPPREGPSL